MNDRLSASWVLIAGSVFIAYWYYRTKGKEDSTGSPSVPATVIGPQKGTPLERLLGFVKAEGLPAPSHSQTTGGRHAIHSLHYQGRAVDVGTRGLSPSFIEKVIADAKAAGFRVLRELYTGNGPYGPSSGPHLHIELPLNQASIPTDIDAQMAQEIG